MQRHALKYKQESKHKSTQPEINKVRFLISAGIYNPYNLFMSLFKDSIVQKRINPEKALSFSIYV